VRMTSLAPILTTEDMDRSVRFYVDVLGFTCGMQTPGYANLYRDAVRIMLAAPNAHGDWKGANFTGQLYIDLETADEVDALWATVKDRAEVIHAVDDFDYGAHEFGIRDDNGILSGVRCAIEADHRSTGIGWLSLHSRRTSGPALPMLERSRQLCEVAMTYAPMTARAIP